MVNTDGNIPSIIIAWVVIVWQLSVKYQRNVSVGTAIGSYSKYIYKNNLLIVKKLNKQIKLD
jgi:hypothetical protein